MKVPPKRKGNVVRGHWRNVAYALNESPSEKEGKVSGVRLLAHHVKASMKALPKRKGNSRWTWRSTSIRCRLNESLSHKEGK